MGNHVPSLLSFAAAGRTDEGKHLRHRMRSWGVTYALVADELSVSRQYVWQVVHRAVPVSPRQRMLVSNTIETLIIRRRRSWTFGCRLRASRVASGLTLRQVAAMTGYTWVAVQRWEKDVCRPKPGVLWHLRMLYGVGDDWTPAALQQGNERLSA